jgi:iron complex outermembrane recepter protein
LKLRPQNSEQHLGEDATMTMFSKTGLMLGSALVGTMIAMPQIAVAQSAAPAAAEEATGIQDIIVTARRTSENLQTVPVAVTALNSEALDAKQVFVVTDLARTAPSLSIGTGGTGPASIVYLAIRGQAQNSPNSLSDASVGVYIDGVYVARPIVANLGFVDAASAEVLRGPQGTLFGRNTTGGALNLTSNQPTDRFEGNLKLGVGNYRQRVVEGVLNIPLGDEVAARFAGNYNQRSGYYPNPISGVPQGSVEGSYFARATIKWTPSELPITLTLSGDYAYYRDNGNPTALAALNPTGPLNSFSGISAGVQAGTIPGAAPIPLGPGFSVPASTFTNFNQTVVGTTGLSKYINPYFTAAGASGSNWQNTYARPNTGNREIDDLHNLTIGKSATGTFTWDMGGVDLKSITAYRESRANNSLDLTGTPTGGGAFVSEYINKQFSEELQLTGKAGALDWITGVYYFVESGTERSDSAIFYNAPIAAFSRALADYRSASTGVFAQVNYHVTDALRITGGLRYTWDQRSINRHGISSWKAADPICSVGVNSGKAASVAPCNDPDSASFQYPAWTAGVDYKLGDQLFIYAKTSGASMSGGFNSRPVPAGFSGSFSPEKVKDVEIGFKGEFFDRRVRTNIAAFTAWQSQVQRIVNTTFVDAGGTTRLTQFVTNAGKVKASGIEFEGTVLPWKGMVATASIAYLDAKYVAGSRFENQLVGTTVVKVDRSGEPITQAPKWTWNLGATQSFDTSIGTFALHADYAYVSSRAFDAFTTGNPANVAAVAAANQASIIRGYGLLNGRVTFTLPDPKIEIAVWGRNVLNQASFTNVFNSYTGIGSVLQFQGAPATYGMTLGFKF